MKTKLLFAIMFVGVTTLFAQNIPSYVPTNGLIGYWPFNGNANDESGNGNHGTVNGATLTTDKNGNVNSAYSFNLNSDVITCSSNNFQNQQFTISSWCKVVSGFSYTTMNIVKYGPNDETSYGGYSLRLDQNDGAYGTGKYAVYGFISDNSKASYVIQNSLNFSNVSSWNNYVISKKNDSIYLYLNSKLIGKELSNIASVSFINAILQFGNQQNLNNNQAGFRILDDIAIYNRALTQQEITALYSGTSASTLSSTKVFVDAPAKVNQNDTLELAISTEALNPADNVISFQTDFAYDSTRYTYISKNLLGTLNTNGNVVVNSSKNGKLNISYMSQTALNGAGSLVKLKFKANNKVGQGIFSLSNFLYNTSNITSLKSDTVNTLDVTPPTAKITYSVNPARKGDSLLITVSFSEKMAVSPVPQFNLTGQNKLANTNLTKVNDSTYSYWWVVEKGNGAVNVNLATGKDLAGNLIVTTPTQNPSFTVLPTLFGDIDTNKLVQAYDAALALQYSVGLNSLPTMDPLPWSNWRLAVANVDTVGSVTANDASLILQHSAKLINSFPADAKKRAGDAPSAEVTVKREGNQLVFRTTGTLYGFNVFSKDNFNVFGQPTINDKNAIVATNIKTNTYNVGIASTTPLAENEPFLVIPIVSTNDVSGTMDVIVNTQEKSLAYGGALAINEATITTMHLYPNPTKDVVTIQNATGKMVQIMDVQGRMIHKQTISSDSHEISLKSIGAKGTYILHIVDGNGISIQENKIVLE